MDKPPTDGHRRPESCQKRRQAGYCLTSLSEATRKLVDKPPKGAAEGLKAGYCLTSLSEATRKLVEAPKGAAEGLKPGYCRFLKPLENYWTSPRQMAKVVRKAAKSAGKGAAERLKAGYCLTSLSEATRKVLGQCQAKRLPNVASCLTPLFLGRAPPADGWGRWLGSADYRPISLFLQNLQGDDQGQNAGSHRAVAFKNPLRF